MNAFEDEKHQKKVEKKGKKWIESRKENQNTLLLFFDGACSKKVGGIGVVIYNEKDEIVYKHNQYLGNDTTNNQMEYAGVLWGMNVVN